MAEYISKMDMYLRLEDEQLKDDRDEKSIGLILCKTKDGLVAEYALHDVKQPIGISEYKLNELLPDDIKGELPSIQEIEEKLEEGLKKTQNPIIKSITALKEKLDKTGRRVITTAVTTTPLLQSLFEQSLKPLFEQLLLSLKELDDLFLTSSYGWDALDTQANSLELLELESKKETFFEHRKSIRFWYRHAGLKKGGIDARDLFTTIEVKFDQYYYGIIIFNYLNNQPFWKYSYDQQLDQKDIEGICNTDIEMASSDIERLIGI